MQDPKSPSSTRDMDHGSTATYDRRPEASGSNPPSSDSTNGTASNLQEKATEKASELQEKATEKVSEYGSKIQETADAGIDRAAGGLEKAAEQLRTRAEDGGGVQEKVGVRVADGLDKTSQYLRDHEAQEIWTEVEQFVKAHPMQAALGAAVAGYVVAKMMK